MAKFVAQTVDLNLELELLDGTEEKLKPNIVMNTKNIMRIVDEWTEIEKVDEDTKKSDQIKAMANELAIVYEKDVEWWLDNFDPITLGKVLEHVATTIGSLKKNKEPLN